MFVIIKPVFKVIYKGKRKKNMFSAGNILIFESYNHKEAFILKTRNN